MFLFSCVEVVWLFLSRSPGSSSRSCPGSSPQICPTSRKEPTSTEKSGVSFVTCSIFAVSLQQSRRLSACFVRLLPQPRTCTCTAPGALGNSGRGLSPQLLRVEDVPKQVLSDAPVLIKIFLIALLMLVHLSHILPKHLNLKK